MALADAEVSSANTVGYTEVPVESGKWYMLAPQFETIGAETTATANLLSIMTLKGIEAVSWASRTTGSQIQVYNPSTKAYTFYYYTTQSGVTGWRRNPTVATEIPVAYGSGVWMKVVSAEEGASVTLAGEVSDSSSFTINVGEEGEWQILSHPLPVAITQENITTSGITAVPWASRNSGSQIQVYNPSTKAYTFYYYTSGNGGTFWRKNPAAPASTDVICPEGQSVWIKAVSSGSITLSL